MDEYCEDESLIDPDDPHGGITAAQLRDLTIAMLREAGYEPSERPARRLPAGEEPIRKSRRSPQ